MSGVIFHSEWLRGSGRPNRKPAPHVPVVSALEDRCLLSTYTLTVLGPGIAYGINDAGLVVGGGGQAFTWDSTNGRQALKTIGGDGVGDAHAVSPQGLIVGDAPAPTPGNPAHAFLNDHGTLTDLGTLGGAISSALGVNDAGQVVGWSDTDDLGHTHAFLWDSQNGLQDLGTFGGWGSIARGINSSGVVVGASATPGDTGHAFVWDSDDGMQDIGSGDIESGAMGINDAGQVVGGANGHAFLYDGGSLIDLGNLGHGYGAAYAINDAGVIVGGTDARDSFEEHGFVFADGVMTDLNDLVPPGSGLTIRVAEAINNSGQIVGYAQDRFSHNFAILLTPDGLGSPRGGNPDGFGTLAPVAVAAGIVPITHQSSANTVPESGSGQATAPRPASARLRQATDAMLATDHRTQTAFTPPLAQAVAARAAIAHHLPAERAAAVDAALADPLGETL